MPMSSSYADIRIAGPMPAPRLCRQAGRDCVFRVNSVWWVRHSSRVLPSLSVGADRSRERGGVMGNPGSPRRKAGALAGHVDGYRAWLAGRGYTAQTVRHLLRDLGQVGLWLSRNGLGVAGLDEEQLAVHVADLREAGRRRVCGPRGLVPLLMYLRECGVVP